MRKTYDLLPWVMTYSFSISIVTKGLNKNVITKINKQNHPLYKLVKLNKDSIP